MQPPRPSSTSYTLPIDTPPTVVQSTHQRSQFNVTRVPSCLCRPCINTTSAEMASLVASAAQLHQCAHCGGRRSARRVQVRTGAVAAFRAGHAASVRLRRGQPFKSNISVAHSDTATNHHTSVFPGLFRERKTLNDFLLFSTMYCV